MNQQSEMKSHPMARISRTFSTALRRTSGADGGGKDRCQDDDHKRKVSVDCTVFSGDDSRHTPSQDFSRSFDGNGFLPPNYSPEFTYEEFFAGSTALTMMPSHSDPSIFQHRDTQPGLYPCFESSRSITSQGHELQRPSIHPHSGIRGAPLQSPSLHLSHPQPSFYRFHDPTLQARIDAIRIQQKLLGENHPDVIFALSSLAKLQQKRGNHTEAAAILRESKMRIMLAQSNPQFCLGGYCVQNPQELDHSDVPNEISFSHQV
jgi:hypothetical protein